MTEFLIYQGKAAIALAVFYMFYRLLLSKETFHRFNRIVLLGTAALSFVLPLCVITFKEVVVVPAMTASSETFVGEVAGTAAMVPEVSEPIWPVILCSLFALGALAVVINAVISIFGIKRMIRSGSSEVLESGETLIITETDTAPFSWMKYIVISREDYESGYSQILTHEKAHIALRHSWDILFVDMITALQWFNPAIWMLKADLRALHEFEADDAVLRSGANIKEYQYLLIRKAVSKSGYSVANSFNHSTLKARITMMLNKKSSRMSAWKALYVIPLVGISLAATAETKVDYQYEGQQPETVADTPVGKDNEKNVADAIPEGYLSEVVIIAYGDVVPEDIHHGKSMEKDALPRLPKQDVDTEAQCSEHFGKWLSYRMQYSGERKYEGTVLTRFTVDKKGKVGNVQILWNLSDALDEAVVNLIQESPVWTPATKNGKPVAVDLIQPVTFKLRTKKKEPVSFHLLDQQPTFNGGDANEFAKWVSQNLKYPEKCLQSKIQGRVTLKFTLTEEGKVTDVTVLRGVNDELDKEAVRVVRESPLWTPGKDKEGKTVPVTYTFPVLFQLPKDGDTSIHYLQADAKPTFNGGDANEFAKWIYSQLQYPEECKKAGIEGRVSVGFTVGTDGKLTDIRILKGAHEQLDAEALRVIKMSPDWTPGMQDGKPVPVSFTFPVNFEIPDSENK